VRAINNQHGDNKMQEKVMIDGKWYDANLNEIPVKSHTILGITFTEGNDYSNYFGTYRVLSFISDTHMQVQYTKATRSQVKDGQIEVYRIAAQAETIFNDQKRVAIEMKNAGAKVFKGSKDTFTLAYIKEFGTIAIVVPLHEKETYPAKYKRITGDDVTNHLENGYSVRPKEGTWGKEMTVSMPYNETILDNLQLPENIKVEGNNITLSHNEFVTGLFYAGFRIGKNKDNEKLAQLAA
jgi:hypothetical protein